MSEDAVLCARDPFTWGAEAVIAKFTEDFGVPEDVKASGFIYFLGQEDVIRLLDIIASKHVSRRTKAEFLCHYAALDTYPAWFEDLPNKKWTKRQRMSPMTPNPSFKRDALKRAP
jgi:hypothetical protein